VRLALLFVIGCSSSDPPAPQPVPEPVKVTPDASVAVVVDAPPRKPPIAIVDTPMKWSTKREALTLDYRRAHSDREAADLTIEPKVIVLHYTAGGSGKSTREYMDNVEIEASRPELRKAGAVNVSSHFVIERDGTIYRIQPETRFARHCIGLNHIAIGIENVGDDKKWPLTGAQVEANVALVRDLAARFPITHLLGHFEAMKFKKHAYYRELDPSYGNDKPDPGAAFMKKVRDKVGDLKLSGL
jgi:N-acetyl-anhydromuramyl-L-alanine amidase AmpD